MKEADALFRELRNAGCSIEKRKRSGHVKITTPNGPVFAPSTPSDWRALKNLRSVLRKKGVAV